MKRPRLRQRTYQQILVEEWEKKNSSQKFPAAVWKRWGEIGRSGMKRSSMRGTLSRWGRLGGPFKKHPGLQKAIVSLLCEVRPVSEAELFGTSGDEPRPGRVPCLAFPALGAFDPAKDEPYRMAALYRVRGSDAPVTSFADSNTAALDLLDLPVLGARVWAFVPPGGGRSFAAAWARRPPRPPSSPYVLPFAPPRVLSLTTPSVAAIDDIDEGAQLLIELDAVSDELPAFVERLATRRGTSAVIAPFVPAHLKPEFHLYVWRPNAAWRDGFVRWVARRLEALGHRETRLNAADFLAWSARIDPDVTHFGTAGSLLPLLDYAHVNGIETLTKQFGTTLVRSVLKAMVARLGGATPRDRWLRDHGEEVFIRMLKAWWRSSDLRWDETPTRETWERLVPTEALPSITEQSERARSIAIEFGRHRLPKARREELVEELKDLLDPDVPAQEAVRALAEAHVLRDIGIAAIGVSLPWMGEAAARSTITASFDKGHVGVWGRWVVDPTRRPLVEKLLFAGSDVTLEKLIRRAVEAFDATSLGAVAEVEALFVVVGDRLVRERSFARMRRPLLRALALLQVELLAPHFQDGLPSPRTRGGPGESSRGGDEFVAACWGWSLRFDALPSLPSGSEWLFPGWTVPSLDHIPGAMTDMAFDGSSRGAELMRILRPEVLERATGTLDRASRSHRASRGLAEAAILVATRRGWSMSTLASVFRGTSIEESGRIAKSVAALPDDLRAQTIDALWGAVLDESKDVLEALRYFEPAESYWLTFPSSALSALMQERFPVERVEAAVGSGGRWDERSGERLLRATPAEHRAQIARALVQACPADAHMVTAVLRTFGRELVDVLLEVVARAPRNGRSWVVQVVWEVAPDVARDQAARAYADGEIDPWINSMPAERLGELVDLVDQHPSLPVPDALRFWLSRRLVEIGPGADKVWTLLQRAGWPACVEAPRTA